MVRRALTPDTRFADLGAAVDFWHEQQPERTVPDVTAWQDLLPRDRELLRQFLGRLCDTVDYRHRATRTRLAGQVCDLLQAMHEYTELRPIPPV